MPYRLFNGIFIFQSHLLNIAFTAMNFAMSTEVNALLSQTSAAGFPRRIGARSTERAVNLSCIFSVLRSDEFKAM